MAGSNYVAYNLAQTRTDAEKLQACNNIGAAGISSLAASFESRAPSYNWGAGEVCTYGGALWQFDADHSGPWTGADAHEIKTLNSSNVADEYDPTATYPIIGTPCIHEGAVYRSKTAITTAEDWNPSHWEKTRLIVDAPADGIIYSRKNGEWVNSSAILSYIDVTSDFDTSYHKAGLIIDDLKILYNPYVRLVYISIVAHFNLPESISRAEPTILISKNTNANSLIYNKECSRVSYAKHNEGSDGIEFSGDTVRIYNNELTITPTTSYPAPNRAIVRDMFTRVVGFIVD